MTARSTVSGAGSNQWASGVSVTSRKYGNCTAGGSEAASEGSRTSIEDDSDTAGQR